MREDGCWCCPACYVSLKSQSRNARVCDCHERVRVWRSMGPKEDREILCCRHFSLSNCIEIAQKWVEDRDCRRVGTLFFSGPRWVLGVGIPGWENCDNPLRKQARANRIASSSTAWQQGPSKGLSYSLLNRRRASSSCSRKLLLAVVHPQHRRQTRETPSTQHLTAKLGTGRSPGALVLVLFVGADANRRRFESERQKHSGPTVEKPLSFVSSRPRPLQWIFPRTGVKSLARPAGVLRECERRADKEALYSTKCTTWNFPFRSIFHYCSSADVRVRPCVAMPDSRAAFASASVRLRAFSTLCPDDKVFFFVPPLKSRIRQPPLPSRRSATLRRP